MRPIVELGLAVLLLLAFVILATKLAAKIAPSRANEQSNEDKIRKHLNEIEEDFLHSLTDADFKKLDCNDPLFDTMRTQYVLAMLNMARMRLANKDDWGDLKSCDPVADQWTSMQDVDEWMQANQGVSDSSTVELRNMIEKDRRLAANPNVSGTKMDSANRAKQDLMLYMGATSFQSRPPCIAHPDQIFTETHTCCDDKTTLQCPDAIQTYLPDVAGMAKSNQMYEIVGDRVFETVHEIGSQKKKPFTAASRCSRCSR